MTDTEAAAPDLHALAAQLREVSVAVANAGLAARGGRAVRAEAHATCALRLLVRLQESLPLGRSRDNPDRGKRGGSRSAAGPG